MAPLTGIRVLEFGGLAPGPFAGMVLADYGASVLRVERSMKSSIAGMNGGIDFLTRRKGSIKVDMKSQEGIEFIKELLKVVDVVIDPFRPGVLERLGLGPEEVMRKINTNLIVARLSGHRRDGKFKDKAGHDINYIAVAGILEMIGESNGKPYAPGNLLGDFAGGGLMCVVGVLLALVERNKSGAGQVVEVNMVDGSMYLATWPRLAKYTTLWSKDRGCNILDGGCPYYGTYETRDGGFMAIGPLEDKFFEDLLQGLNLDKKLEAVCRRARTDSNAWEEMRNILGQRFKEYTRAEWEKIFEKLDACITPVYTFSELKERGFDMRPPVRLLDTPGLAIKQGGEGEGNGIEGDGWELDCEGGIHKHGEKLVELWTNRRYGKDFIIRGDGSISLSKTNGQSKL